MSSQDSQDTVTEADIAANNAAAAASINNAAATGVYIIGGTTAETSKLAEINQKVKFFSRGRNGVFPGMIVDIIPGENQFEIAYGWPYNMNTPEIVRNNYVWQVYEDTPRNIKERIGCRDYCIDNAAKYIAKKGFKFVVSTINNMSNDNDNFALGWLAAKLNQFAAHVLTQSQLTQQYNLSIFSNNEAGDDDTDMVDADSTANNGNNNTQGVSNNITPNNNTTNNTNDNSAQVVIAAPPAASTDNGELQSRFYHEGGGQIRFCASTQSTATPQEFSQLIDQMSGGLNGGANNNMVGPLKFIGINPQQQDVSQLTSGDNQLQHNVTDVFTIIPPVGVEDADQSLCAAGELHTMVCYRVGGIGEVMTTDEIKETVTALMKSESSDDDSIVYGEAPPVHEKLSFIQVLANVLECPIHLYEYDTRYRAVVPNQGKLTRGVLNLVYSRGEEICMEDDGKDSYGKVSYAIPKASRKLHEALYGRNYNNDDDNDDDDDDNQYWTVDDSATYLTSKEKNASYILVNNIVDDNNIDRASVYYIGQDKSLSYTAEDRDRAFARAQHALGHFERQTALMCNGGLSKHNYINNDRVKSMTRSEVETELERASFFRRAENRFGAQDPTTATRHLHNRSRHKAKETHANWAKAGKLVMDKLAQSQDGSIPVFDQSRLDSTDLIDVFNDEGKARLGAGCLMQRKRCLPVYHCSHNSILDNTNAPFSIGHLDSLPVVDKWWSSNGGASYIGSLNHITRMDIVAMNGMNALSPNRMYPHSNKPAPYNPHTPVLKYEDKNVWMHKSAVSALHFALFHDARRVHNYGEPGAPYGDTMDLYMMHPDDLVNAITERWSKHHMDFATCEHPIIPYAAWQVRFAKGKHGRYEYATFIKYLDEYVFCKPEVVDLKSI